MPRDAAADTAPTSLREFQEHDDWSRFSAGVSLHAHTHHSREIMADLPRYLARIPLVAACVDWQLRTYSAREGRAIDFSKGWWHPPVSPRTVFESEARQIETRFGLSPLVSITDHDDISAGLDLQCLFARRRAPVSVEWSVPYGNGHGFFHLGVHNLTPETAGDWFARLAAFTARSTRETLGHLLDDLNAQRDLLLVLNHPIWDLAAVGQAEHTRLLTAFMAAHASRIHAIEWNGYRSRKENGDARALAVSSGRPLIGGGDRHGRAPNAILNVTRARTFGEFANEVRDGVSHVVVMPEYRQHLVTRKLKTASEVLRHYQSYPAGRQDWTDRISCDSDGSVRPLSFHWPNGGPLWVRSSIGAFQVVTSPIVLPVIRAALETVDGVRGSWPDPAGGKSGIGTPGLGEAR
jgi:hypothetical protein